MARVTLKPVKWRSLYPVRDAQKPVDDNASVKTPAQLARLCAESAARVRND